MKPLTAYISLGGNMGNEAELFGRAVARIGAWPEVGLRTVSGLYRTQPQDSADQPWFCNQVAAFDCGGSVRPLWFLESLLSLETELGRARDPERRFGPRVIDLDLLVFGDIVCSGKRLRLPHPRMTRRAFVLVPLSDIAPNLVLPGGETVMDCLKRLEYTVNGCAIFQNEGRKEK